MEFGFYRASCFRAAGPCTQAVIVVQVTGASVNERRSFRLDNYSGLSSFQQHRQQAQCFRRSSRPWTAVTATIPSIWFTAVVLVSSATCPDWFCSGRRLHCFANCHKSLIGVRDFWSRLKWQPFRVLKTYNKWCHYYAGEGNEMEKIS